MFMMLIILVSPATYSPEIYNIQMEVQKLKV